MFIQQQYINLRQNSHLREFLVIRGKRYAEIAVGYLYSHYLQPPPIASIHHICSITTKFCFYNKEVSLQLDTVLLYLTDVQTPNRQHSCPQALDCFFGDACGKGSKRGSCTSLTTLCAD